MAVGIGTQLIVLLAGVLGITGIALLILGVRGRRVGEEPRCGKCGYDLRGVEREAPCPECGEAAGSRRTGRSRRRPAMISVGIVLILVCSATMIAPVRQWASTIDYYAVAPSWLLVRWGVNDGDLKASDTIASRWIDGEATDEQVVAVLKPLFRVTLATRDHHAGMTHIPIHWEVSSIPPGGPFNGALAQTISSLHFEVERTTTSGTSGSSGTGLGSSSSSTFTRKVEPGQPYVYELRLSISVSTEDASRAVSWSEEYSITSNIVDDSIEWPGLTLLDDEATEQRIVDGFFSGETMSVVLGEAGFASFDPRSPDALVVDMIELPGDVPIYASVVAAGETNADVVYSLVHRGTGPVSIFPGDLERWVGEFSGETVMILKPDLEVAWREPTLERVWAKELRFRVRVREKRIEIVEQITEW